VNAATWNNKGGLSQIGPAITKSVGGLATPQIGAADNSQTPVLRRRRRQYAFDAWDMAVKGLRPAFRRRIFQRHVPSCRL
jgi:hypothetical protein